MKKVRDTFLQPRDGLYPFIDSVYGGGGFTLGAGFLRYYGDRSSVDAHGLYSIKNYKLFEVTSTSPGHLGNRLELGARGGLARRNPGRLLRSRHRHRQGGARELSIQAELRRRVSHLPTRPLGGDCRQPGV